MMRFHATVKSVCMLFNRDRILIKNLYVLQPTLHKKVIKRISKSVF